MLKREEIVVSKDQIINNARKQGRTVLTEIESKKVLEDAGINTIKTRLASSQREAIALSDQIGFPVVLKIASPDISHKSDAGGVKVGLKNREEVKKAFEEIMTSAKQKYPTANIQGVSVQSMARPGIEIIIGMTKDPQFGPVLMFGLGGVLVEVLKDVSFRIAPLTRKDAKGMIEEIRGYPLLNGYRGQEPANISFLENLLLKVSDFVEQTPEIKEIDLNPVFAYSDDAIVVDARVVLEDEMRVEGEVQMPQNSLEFLFHPKSIAIVGASNNPASFGCDFMNYILSYGYNGRIYPINPKQNEIMGLKAYPSIEHVPGTIDYVICCIAVINVPDLLTQCCHKGVKAMHIFAGRASETGRPEAKKLEVEILRQAKQYDIRLLGPNCLGIFCPKSGLSFGYDFPKELGNVGGIIQSGGNSTDLIHFASLRGIRFSKVVSYGNALDINQNDLLEYFSQDPETKIILCFIEGLKGDGRKFLGLLRKAASLKPVVICKGGRTRAGARWALSHTASLAGSAKIWEVAIRQAGAIPVRDIDELVNMAVAFYFLPPIKGMSVGIGGGGGGRSVLSADEWEENGFDLPPMPNEIREEFRRRGSQLWDWMNNPADVSILVPGEPYSVPAALIEMSNHPDFDFIAANVSEDFPFGKQHFIEAMENDVGGYIKVSKECNKPFIVIFGDRPLGTNEMDSWRYRTIAQMRTRLIEEGVPFFPTVDQAAKAIKELIAYYGRKEEEVA